MSKISNTLKSENQKLLKYASIFFLHVGAAFILALVLVLTLSYLGWLGELASSGIYSLWKAYGSYCLSGAILLLSILVITLTNPVYALICLIFIFFSAAVFLISLQVNFLAMIYLIIYIGAIAILFLFVIMMFNLRELTQPRKQTADFSSLYLSFGFYFLVLWKFYSILLNDITTYIEYDPYFAEFAKIKRDSFQYFLTYQQTDVLLFATLLYEYYSYLFLFAGLILLTAMIGSIILALSTTEKTALSKKSE